MKKMIDRLKAFDKETGQLNVVIETPKGSRVKYAYEPKTGFFILSKALPEGMSFPFNFGFVPKTLGADGDPLDVLILNEEPLMSGCLLHVKPVAIIKAEQMEGKQKVRNDRIIGMAIGKETPLELKPVSVSKEMVHQIEFFFKAYNKQYGKKFHVVGTGGPKQALLAIRKGMKAFKAKK